MDESSDRSPLTPAPALDHLVYAVRDLSLGIARFTQCTGVQPVRGGTHVGLGTANHLLRLTGVGVGAAAYLEIIGPDPRQEDPAQPRPFGIDELLAPRLVSWAVRTSHLDALIAEARDGGYDPGEPSSMSRETPDGDVLRWRLTRPRFDYGEGLVPFLIDWGDSPHPTSRSLPSVELVTFRATHPDPASIRPALAALRADLHIDIADHAALIAAVRAPGSKEIVDL